MKHSNGNPTKPFQGETISRVNRNGKNAKKKIESSEKMTNIGV